MFFHLIAVFTSSAEGNFPFKGSFLILRLGFFFLCRVYPDKDVLFVEAHLSIIEWRAIKKIKCLFDVLGGFCPNSDLMVDQNLLDCALRSNFPGSLGHGAALMMPQTFFILKKIA